MNKAPLFDLSGKVILLTGGGGILGSRFTRSLVAHGAYVAVADRNLVKANSVAAAILEDEADRAKGYSLDVTSRDSWMALQEILQRDCGGIDVLINNAATKTPNFFESFETFPMEDWETVMKVNVTGAMLGCQVCGTVMAQRGYGSIINILSVYGIVGPDPRIYQGSLYEGRPINTPAVYSTSKAAVWGLTKHLAAYWGNRGVRVNAITPGGVQSGQNDNFVKRYSARVPLGRMADQDDLNGALVFLASDASSYMTGQNVIVDGGLTAW